MTNDTLIVGAGCSSHLSSSATSFLVLDTLSNATLDFRRRRKNNPLSTLSQRIRRDVGYVAQRTRDVIRREQMFERFLRRSGPVPAREGVPAVVVVQPWWGTGEPWCMLATALLLQKQYGNTVVL